MLVFFVGWFLLSGASVCVGQGESAESGADAVGAPGCGVDVPAAPASSGVDGGGGVCGGVYRHADLSSAVVEGEHSCAVGVADVVGEVF